MPKQLVVVFTATGAQGLSIVEFLTTDPTAKSLYTVRALTRNTSSPTASKLAALGAQVVKYSLDSDSSVAAAVQDANIIFANSDFWSVYTVEAEVAQGRRILVAAAKLPNLTHFVQSSFPDAKKISNGKFNGVLHYNAKNEINAISANEYPDLWEKTTNVWVGYYYQNWLKFNFPFGPQKVLGENGKVTGYVQPMPYAPSTKISTVWPGDLGAVFFAIAQGGAKFHGKTVAVVGEQARDDERLATWARVLGVSARFEQVTPETYSARMTASGAMPPPIVQDVTEQLLLLGLGEYISGDNIIPSRDIIDPSYHMKSWEEYCKEEDWSSIL